MLITDLYTSDIHEEGAEMEIVEPSTGKGTGAFFTIYGPDSKSALAATRKANAAIVERYRKAAKEDLDTNAVMEETESEIVDKVLASIKDWKGITDKEGKDIPFNRDMCRELLENSPNVFSQVNKFSSDYANFTKG